MRKRAAQAATPEMARMGAEAPPTPLLSALPRPTPRLFGAVALAAVVEYYGSTSEVSWLFLLAGWIAALCVVCFAYALWNRAGLRLSMSVRGINSSVDSPAGDLPSYLLRNAPLPAPP